MTITCCAPAHLHQLPSLAGTSNQHRANCRFPGRKASLIRGSLYSCSSQQTSHVGTRRDVTGQGCGIATWGDKGQGAEGALKLCLGVGKEGRGGCWPQPSSSAVQGQHKGVTAWALSQELGSTTRETMELFRLGTAFQGQAFSGEKKHFIFKK